MKLITDVFAVLIALAAFAVSYTTQVLLASQHGFPGWEAWLWPGIADAAALAMILRLHFGQVQDGWYTFEAWAVFGLAAAVMIAANSIADMRDLLNGAMHGVVPIVAMAVWHVIIRGRRGANALEEEQPASKPRAATALKRAPRGSTAARALRLIEQAPDVSSGELAKRLRVSRSHAARLLREARPAA